MTSEEGELQACYRAVWDQLARSTRTAMFDPASVRLSGAYWPLTTACFLVGCCQDVWPKNMSDRGRSWWRQARQALAPRAAAWRQCHLALNPAVTVTASSFFKQNLYLCLMCLQFLDDGRLSYLLMWSADLSTQLRLNHARDIWVNTNHSHRMFFRQVEAFLARKQPTSRELRALVPKVLPGQNVFVAPH